MKQKPGLQKLLCVFLLILLLPLFAEENFSVSRQIDWNQGLLFIDINRKLNMATDWAPDSRLNVELEIQDRFFGFFYDTILPLQVDSSRTLKDILQTTPSLPVSLNLIIKNSKKIYSFIDREKGSVNVRYSCDLFGAQGLVSSFVNHQYIKPLPLKLGFVPSRIYSGIVIYAKGEYSLYGEKAQGVLNPVFFPDFFDEEMNLIFSREMCDPEALKKWGMVAYTSSFDDTPYLKRIGAFPLRTIVVKIFGVHKSDIILSNEVINRLLSREANRELLRQGRVLIILDL